MAFNQGPEPAIVLDQNGIRYVDPNPTDQIVNHEDLVIYVKFVARTKGRSILTVSDEETTIDIEQKFVRSNTNFTYPDGKNQIDTDWTNLGGGPQDPGEDIGTFGITNINIDFKSSFMPKIVVDFVDVRGATLFEQGPCSPYSAFFHLPYPVFELTVKGYYGKPVTYTLALIKFTTKFNAETGNFESKGEFIGYTYAFLADIPMGYIMASTYMKQGKDVFPEIWAKYANLPGISDSIDGIPQLPMTLYDLIKVAKKLESATPQLKNSFEIIDLAKLGKLKNALTNLRTEIVNMEVEWLKVTVGRSKTAGIKTNTDNQKHTLFANIPQTSSTRDNVLINSLYDGKLSSSNEGVIFPFLGDGTETGYQASKIGSLLTLTNGIYALNSNVGATPPTLPLQNIKDNMNGFWDKQPETIGDSYSYNIDVHKALLKEVDDKLKEVDKSFKTKQNSVKDLLNQKVKEILGFNPSIRNVFAIILANCEVFLEILRQTSVQAEVHHDTYQDDILGKLHDASKLLDLKDTTVSGNGAEESNETIVNKNDNKIYPWPTYYETTSVTSKDSPGNKETYPGENIEFTSWPEVQFVEDFIKALTEMKEDLTLLEGEVDNLPGFDNFAPISVLETPILGFEKASCRWLNVGRGSEQILIDGEPLGGFDNLYATIGENAFLVGDYSFINTLTLWKSQLGFDNGWGFQTLTGGKGGLNGYTSSNLGDNTIIEPQTLAENPKVDTSATNLGRYGGSGMPFSKPDGKFSFKYTKVSPTTKEVMKRYGYIDGLNCMSTLFGEQDANSISHLKAAIASGDVSKEAMKEKIKEQLKKKWGGNYKTQTFNDWAKTATAAIGGDKELVTKQNLWDAHYTYVKSNNVLTLTGPIPNSVSEVNNENWFSANPYNNPRSGVTLMSQKALDSFRSLEFDENVVPTKLLNAYAAKHGINSDSITDSTPVAEDDGPKAIESADFTNIEYKNALNQVLIQDRPIPRNASSGLIYSPYRNNKSPETVTDKNCLVINKRTQLLENSKQNKKLYYRSYTDMGGSGNKSYTGENQIIWDIGSSRTVYTRDNYYQPDWNDFVGSAHENKTGDFAGAYDPFVQTPLWTLNYPSLKMPRMGNANIIADFEIVSKDTDGTQKKKGKEVNLAIGNGKEGPKNLDLRWANNRKTNISRNFATWWGINSWGTDPDRANDDYVLPLAYLFVLSLGFDNIKNAGMALGHYYPNDGGTFNQQSPFSIFSHYPGIFKMPRTFVLLIGAILWRAKEGGMLRWDKLDPKVGNLYRGWNKAAENGSANGPVGIDDLGDPVWFFHNCISKPWELGGAVFTNNIGLESSGKNDVYDKGYLRQYIGERYEMGHNIDGWTESAGAPGLQDYYNKNKNVGFIIGGAPKDSNGNWYYKLANDASGISAPFNVSLNTIWWTEHNNKNFEGWVKSHQPYNQGDPSAGGAQSSNPINRGMFDQCRQDQIPFLVPQFSANNIGLPGLETKDGPFVKSKRKYYEPATLMITDLQDNTGRKAYFGVPSVDASIAKGYNTQAPNREKENGYINLKENVKELMFLPKDLKKDFIDYFENWAKKEYRGKDNVRYLNTVDPLNWSPNAGIGILGTADMYKLKTTHTAVGGYEANGYPAIVRGKSGFLDPVYIKGILNNGVGDGGWWYPYGESTYDNPWFQAYSTDKNVKRTKKYVKPSKPSKATHEYITTCFVLGTKVTMADGTYKNIENVKEGDKILSYNVSTKEFGTDIVLLLPKILGNYQKIIATYEDDTKNEFSPAHPFYIEGKGWSSYGLTDKIITTGDCGDGRQENDWNIMFKKGNLYQLEVGDYCVNNKGEKIQIKSLEKTNEYVNMYNLEQLNNNKTWFANGVLVKE